MRRWRDLPGEVSQVMQSQADVPEDRFAILPAPLGAIGRRGLVLRHAVLDHLLVSADTDNRVILRPRTQLGYAVPLVQLAIPDAGVALPALKPE